MVFIFTVIVIAVIGIVCYRFMKGKSAPSNTYTPYDDITMGKKIDVKRDGPIHDTKHQIQYEEKENTDKNI